MGGAYEWLDAAVSSGATVVTASRRLARELQGAFEQQQQLDGRLSWPTPQVVFWGDWLAINLDNAEQKNLRRLIDPASSAVLWERCLDHTSRQDLLSISGVLRHARQAWQRVHDWRIPLQAVAEAATSKDELWFARAARAYGDLLSADGWIDQAQLAAYSTDVLDPVRLAPGGRVVHAGFDRLTPVQGLFFERLVERGIVVAAAPRKKRAGQRHHRSYKDSDAQWRAAGNWARQIMQQNPAARIAVLVPDLEADAGAIARKVREGFAPGWQLGDAGYRAAVNVSYGQRLVDFPAVVAAEKALRFAAGGLRSADVSLLLRTRFLADDDRAGRSRLELQLRSLPDRLWQPDTLFEALSAEGDRTSAETWRERMQMLVVEHARRDERLSPAAWAQRIDALLAGIGWPGKRQPDSEEFQLINRWRQLLNELARLGAVEAQVTLQDAVGHLFRMASETLYQPEAGAGGLGVAGLLEAAGMEFDHLWVGGLDSSRWPPAGRPLALLSRKLQREAGMPDATPADTLGFASRTLEGLCASSSEVQLTWARNDGDTELQPSPLLKLSAETEVRADHGDPGRYAGDLPGSTKLTLLHPDTAPPVAAGEKIRGGAYTVQCMREEPFSAFIRGRLAAAPLEPFQAGLTPRLRGISLHDALYRLLKEKPTSAQMRDWDDDLRRDLTERAAWMALADTGKHADEVLRRILALEKLRLQQLLRNFLIAECERDDFSIEALEQRLLLQRGAVQLGLRIDRIDRLADGSIMIADYKSGTAKAFMNIRKGAPANVQLVVYASAMDAEIGGLVLINIDSREISYRGEGGSISFGRIGADDWPGVLQSWCAEVDALLLRFASGETGVNSAQSSDDARPLALLSRIEELRREG